jgi:hypothetical protein
MGYPRKRAAHERKKYLIVERLDKKCDGASFQCEAAKRSFLAGGCVSPG